MNNQEEEDNTVKGSEKMEIEQKKLYAEILLKEMEFDWNDHFEIRRQTWKTVTASGAVLIALIGFNFTPVNSLLGGMLLYGGCIVLFLVSFFGLLIAIHHRRCEKDKFGMIRACEKRLVVDDKDTTLLMLLKEATNNRIGNEHSFISTSSFIMVYHGAILLLLLLLLFCRLQWLEYKVFSYDDSSEKNAVVYEHNHFFN